jgi:hypothetical protein
MREKILSGVSKPFVVTTLEHAHTTIGSVTEVFERLSNVCARNSLGPNIAALSLRRRILALRISDFLQSTVKELFATKPRIMNIPLLDLLSSETIAYWRIQSGDGTEHIVHFPASMLMHAGTDYAESVVLVTCINMAVCASNCVVSSKIILDEDDIFYAQAA